MQRSTVYCTNCQGQFTAELDLELDGNHQITCPLCQHIHYRVVENGVVTEERWASSQQGPIFYATTYTTTASASFQNYIISTGTSLSTGDMWLNRSDINFT